MEDDSIRSLDALDKGNCALCFFFADFKKGFDLIDHRVLLRKLSGYGLHPSLVRWLAAFLQGRSQRVQLANVSAASKYPNGGIPQGTKLSPILFAVMVDDLVRVRRRSNNIGGNSSQLSVCNEIPCR